MNKTVTIVIDSDAIIAQANSYDLHHATASAIAQNLTTLQAHFLYPSTTIAEAATYMQRVLNSTASAVGTVQFMTDPSIEVIEVNQETLKNALEYFSPTTSKKNTIFDCIVLAIAKEKKADAIFSFDKFYKKKGFKLASEL